MKCDYGTVGILSLLLLISGYASFSLEASDGPRSDRGVAPLAKKAPVTASPRKAPWVELLTKLLPANGPRPVEERPVAAIDCSGSGKLPAITTCIRQQYGSLIELAAQHTGVHSDIILAVMVVESEGNPHAVSSKLCKGLMQLDADTAKESSVPPDRIFDPRENILGGSRVLASYIKRAGSLDRGLAWYNLGPTGTHRKAMGDPSFAPESFPYVQKVKGVMTQL